MKQIFHPNFIARYSPLFSKEEFELFLEYCQKPLRKAIRVNTSKISLDDFCLRAEKNNWGLEKILYLENAYFINRDDTSVPLGKSIEYFAGLFYIQETSSMIPPTVLDAEEGDIVLDVSAAPGSKTTQIAEKMNGQGLVIGNDIVPSRLKALKTNINYLGMYNAACSKMDGRDFGRYFKEHFDKVLLDAPCSGEGTMRKDEVRWSMSIIEDLSKLQEKLILSAIESLKVGGTLVYSTCTMTPEEDEMILDFAKSQLGDAIEIVPWELNGLKYSHGITEWANMPLDKECANGQKIWPHINDTEGFFIAKIIKRKATDLFDSLIYYPAKNEEILLKGKELKILYAQIRKRFNIDKEIFESMFLVKKGSSIELRSKESKPFASLPFIQNMGIPFGNISNSFEFDFFSAQIFGKYAQINIVDLDEDQADAFKSGKDIKLKKEQCVNCSEGQVIVTFDKFVLGSSLLQKQFKLKNQVPRESIKI